MMIGSVVHYNKDQRFGFIQIPGHITTVFFHNSRQQDYYCGLDAEIHCDRGWESEPEIGEQVIVHAIQVVMKGPRATYWSKAATLKKAEEVQSLMQTYRLQHRDGREAVSRLDPKPKIRTVWCGRDLISLCKYCNDRYVRIEWDEFDYYYFEVMVMETKIETLNTDPPQEIAVQVETWQRCDDPRPK